MTAVTHPQTGRCKLAQESRPWPLVWQKPRLGSAQQCPQQVLGKHVLAVLGHAAVAVASAAAPVSQRWHAERVKPGAVVYKRHASLACHPTVVIVARRKREDLQPRRVYWQLQPCSGCSDRMGPDERHEQRDSRQVGGARVRGGGDAEAERTEELGNEAPRGHRLATVDRRNGERRLREVKRTRARLTRRRRSDCVAL